MKIKRIITALCALIISFGLLTACAEGNQQSQPESSSVPVNESLEEAPDSEALSLSFSRTSGFYDEAFELDITCNSADAKIYYTTDGSEPDTSDTLFEGPIKLKDRSSEKNQLSAQKGTSASGDFIPQQKINKANVIRAAAFLPDGTRSEIISGTYWIGIDRQAKYGSVPVISLFTDTENLFDYEKGIYVLGKTYDDWLKEDENNAKLEAWQRVGNYSNKGREWERPVTVEYIEADGTVAFVQDMGIRVMGAASRNECQKSFRLTAREEYGKKSVKYELIPDNLRSDGEGNVEKYKSFVLRNGGNDCNFAKVRDPYLQSLVTDRRFETQQTTPCVVYLDGEFWGMYTLGEDYNDNYIENNYGIDNNNVVVLKRGSIEDGEESDIELYNQMYDFITGNDMTSAENYDKAEEMLDMDSFIDYCAFNLYIYNEDSIFKNNNWEMWRVRTADGLTPVSDGKWRMMAYDTDFSTGIYSEGKNYSKNNIIETLNMSVSEEEGSRQPGDIFKALYKNEDFKKELVLVMCDLRNLNFESSHASNQLMKYYNVYSQIVPRTWRRFGPDWIAWQDTDAYFTMKINELSVFMNGRYTEYPRLMKSALDLSESAELTLSSSDSSKGTVKLNTITPDLSAEFKGTYFTDYDITLEAIPSGSGKFLRWEYENCTVSDEASEKITVSFSEDFSIRAVFE